jgi:OFA family oxalate/formate antiporter-like MFS transporter
MEKMEIDLRSYYPFRKKLLLIDFFVMMMIGTYQYSWSLSAFAIINELKWDLPTVSVTFTAYLLAQGFIQPVSGMIADAYGPKKIVMLSSFLVAMGFIFSSFISSPWELHLFYALGGLGVGALDNISTAVAVKWFPDKKGFASGFATFGFAAGAGLFNWFIQAFLESLGFRTTFRFLGLFMGVLLCFFTSFYKYPPKEWASLFEDQRRVETEGSVAYGPWKMLGTYQWYLIYFCFIVTISIVLMFGAQIKILLKEFHIQPAFISLIIVTFPIGNGLSRVVAGTVSDRIGRGRTMMLFYGLLGVAIYSLTRLHHLPILFALMVFIVALLGGSPFALYPATIGDYYGLKKFTTNYGITITAKAWGGVIAGWLSGFLVSQFGSYKVPLMLLSIGSLTAAWLSNPLFLRSPKRRND